MSPSKQSIARTVQRPTGTAVSGIPRRVNAESRLRKPQPSVLGDKLKASKPKSSIPARESIFTDKTATPPVKAKSYFSNATLASANKENAPFTRKPRQVLGSRGEYAGLRFNRGGSPTKGNAGVSKPTKTYTNHSPTKTALARIPLRELSDHEVFERDEAALGDLRRRRSGEHSGTYIEVESRLAGSTSAEQPSISPLSSRSTTPEPSVPPVEPSEDAPSPVDAAEALRQKLASIISATAPTHAPSRLDLLRRKLASPIKTRHPALRTSTSSTDSILCSDPGSPVTPAPASPIISRRSTSPIVKSTPSPPRRGLVSKNANMLLKHATEQAETGKKIINISNKEPVLKKKKGSDSLRRAAGTGRNGLLGRMGGQKKGIETIARMR